MDQKPAGEYPKRDLTPEHTARNSARDPDAPIHPEVRAAYSYVDSVLDTADYKDVSAWHGWALREAFLAGCSHAADRKTGAEQNGN